TDRDTIWENSTFESGADGWTPAPDIVPLKDRGNAVKVEPPPGQTQSYGKDVRDQSGGRHRFEFDVMAVGATEASLAKIEVRTTARGWDKKFQIYFGNSMRINYDPDGRATVIVPAVQSARWYHVRLELDLDGRTIDAYVDGQLAAAGVPMAAGPITDLAIWGWDRGSGAVFLDNLLGTVATTPPPVSNTWEDDPFDALPAGPLDGLNGWTLDRGMAPAQIVTASGRGKVVRIEPPPDKASATRKDVPDQSTGRHRFELDVAVDGATEASLAKIEIRTTYGAGWDKKLQVYFGTSMRINYSPSGAATIIVPALEPGRWYRVRLDLNLDTGMLDAYVDDRLVTSGLPMAPGPISELALWGWDRGPGTVSLDNLRGTRLP
ncbi:MAG: hypothetical protein ACRD08_01925, partial [Acidimicrobiales bacterium]